MSEAAAKKDEKKDAKKKDQKQEEDLVPMPSRRVSRTGS